MKNKLKWLWKKEFGLFVKRIKWFYVLIVVVCVVGFIGFFYNLLKKEMVMNKVKIDF